MQAATLPIGTEVGGYVLSGVLGSGASGTVYRAQDAEGVPVALKLLHPAVASDPAARQRLAREVQAQRAIRSPFVAQVVDVELDGTEVFIVTELIEGTTLARDIAQHGPWQASDLAALARDLEQALAAVSAAGVVHRDIKPSNVVLNQHGRPVLIDFGIAQGQAQDRLTGTGLVAGTPGFVAPELLRSGDPAPLTDIWAAIALLLNAATGRQPFGTGPVETVLARVLDGLPDVDGLAPAMAEAFELGLAPEPDQRLTLGELAEVLERAVLAPVETPTGQTRVAPVVSGEAAGGLTDLLEPVSRPPDYPSWADGPGPVRPLGPVGGPAAGPVAAPGWGQPDGWEMAGPGRFGPGWERPDGGWVANPVDDAVASPYPPRPGPVPGLTLALWVLLSATALMWAWVPALVAAIGLIAGRTVWVAAEAMAMRRFRRGQRPSDGARMVVGLPWYLLRGLFGVTPALTLALALSWGGFWLAVQFGDGTFTRAELGAAAVAVGLVLAWWGPSASPSRDGCRLMLRWLTRSTPWRALLALVMVGGAALIIGLWPWGG